MNIMIDLETLGTKPYSIVLSLGAAAFDEEGVQTVFYRTLDIQAQVKMGLSLEASTFQWWMSQSEEAREDLFAKPMAPYLALQEFSGWCALFGDDCLFWSHGASFDIPLLSALYDVCSLPEPWKFRNVRDTRTLFGLLGLSMGDFKTPAGVKHNALADATFQAEEVRKALRSIRGQSLA